VASAAPSLQHAAGISQKNRAYLERLHRETTAAFDAAEAAVILDLDTEVTARLLGYLSRRGWLSRVRRGLYVAVPLDARQSGKWAEDAWIVADRIFAPCYIGGWTACEHWDLTEQLFRTVLVITGKKVRSSEVEVQSAHFHVASRAPEMIFGTVGVWRGQTRVNVSDPSRTVVDVLDHPRLGGGMRHCIGVLREYMTSEYRNDASLVEYADRVGNRSVFKRLGYLLEHSNVPAGALIDECLARRSAGVVALDPSSTERGHIVRRWGLRVNVDVCDASDA
jgi:predicted transcriptional regulator of viral defense system